MKLLYIANQRLPVEKAYGLQVAKMGEAFAAFGLEVSLIAPTRKDPIKQDFFSFYSIERNFRFKKLFSPDFYLPGKLDSLAVVIKSFISASVLAFYSVFRKADLIYSRDEFPLYFLSFFKKNLVFEAHRFSKRRIFFYRRFKNKALKIVVISKGLEKEFINFGFNQKNVLIAHDGVDLKKFDLDLDKSQARLKLDLPEDKKLVGYVGQLRTMGMEKGIDLAIKSLKSLPDDLDLILVGGSGEDIDFYKTLAEKENLAERVLFKGRISHDSIPLWLKAFDALIMPFPFTKHYAFYMSPLKLFEYMASRRPIAASDLPSVREILDEKNSILFNPDDQVSLAEAVKKIFDSPDWAGKMADQAFEDVKNYTWQKRAEKILDFIINKT